MKTLDGVGLLLFCLALLYVVGWLLFDVAGGFTLLGAGVILVVIVLLWRWFRS